MGLPPTRTHHKRAGWHPKGQPLHCGIVHLQELLPAQLFWGLAAYEPPLPSPFHSRLFTGVPIQGGPYIVKLLEEFGAGYSILAVVFLEAIAVSWFYGEEMLCGPWGGESLYKTFSATFRGQLDAPCPKIGRGTAPLWVSFREKPGRISSHRLCKPSCSLPTLTSTSPFALDISAPPPDGQGEGPAPSRSLP